MLVNTVEKYEELLKKHHQSLTPEQRSFHKKAMSEGGFLFDTEEIKKYGWVVRPSILDLHTELCNTLGNNATPLMINKCILGFYHRGKPVYSHHWSLHEPNSPWDFIVKYDMPTNMTFCIDVKGANRQRVSIQPKYGVMPDINGKVSEARKQGWIPFYMFKNPGSDESYLYPLSEGDYLTSLHSNPYTPKMVKRSYETHALVVFFDGNGYKTYLDEGGVLDKKPAIIDLNGITKGEYV